MEPAHQVGRPSAGRGGARLRVALDVTAAAQGAGIGRYTRGLAAALVSRGTHDFIGFSTDRSVFHSGVLDGRMKTAAPPLSTRWMWRLWHRIGLRWPVETWTGPIDVFHATDFLLPPLRSAGGVVTIHDLTFLVCPDRADPGLARYLRRRVPAAVSTARHVLADSRATKRDLVELMGVPSAKITVAYPGIEADFATGTGSDHVADCRARYVLPGPFLLGVGTLEPRKNWPDLIRAFEAAAIEGVTLVIAGAPGWGAREVEQAAWTARAPVRLLGHLPEEDLRALYHGAMGFAYISQYEGFGYPPIEAMACGCPCLTSDGGSLAEVVGDAALVVPVGDEAAVVEGLRQLVGNAELRERLRAAGPEQAARYRWDVTAAVVEHAYLRSRAV